MTAGSHDAWLLDFDGTVYHSRPLKLWMALEVALRGPVHLGTLRRFRHEHERIREHLTDAVESPFDLQVARTAEALNVTAERVREVVDEWMFERPQKWIRRHLRAALLEQARAFRAQGGKLAIVSDYPVSRKLRALDGALAVDIIVANGEQNGPGRLKPHPDGYLRAAQQLGVAPERCLVIGDRPDADGLAATRAGMAFRLVR
jgi:putative hydrolase of the HAD superfamily